MAPIKVGLMGYGFSTKCFHLPFILPNPDYKVVAFLQRAEAPDDKSNVEPGKHCTVDHPEAKHYRTAENFFKDDDMELVIVCTSSDTHYEFGMQALEAGKHGMSCSTTIFKTKSQALNTLRSRDREAFHGDNSRSRQTHCLCQRKEQTSNRLSKPTI